MSIRYYQFYHWCNSYSLTQGYIKREENILTIYNIAKFRLKTERLDTMYLFGILKQNWKNTKKILAALDPKESTAGVGKGVGVGVFSDQEQNILLLEIYAGIFLFIFIVFFITIFIGI